MAHPNRTVAAWRNSNPTFQLVERITVANQFDGDELADNIRASRTYARVKVGHRKIGPKSNPTHIYEVLCYSKI